MRAFLIAIAALASTTAHADEVQLTDAQRGLGLIIAAQEFCDLAINDAAVGEYFTQQGWDRPDTLAKIDRWARLRRSIAADNASPADCAIIRKTAESIGVTAD
jgi:hypothetical protein